jgi:hypothetical protein
MEVDGILLYRNKVYVPNSIELRNLILKEMHNVTYARITGYRKTISSIRGQYYWHGMKKYVVNFIVRCMECQKVRVENKHPAGFQQPFSHS